MKQIQNCNNQQANGQNLHKFLICIHNNPLSAKLRMGASTFPAVRLTIQAV